MGSSRTTVRLSSVSSVSPVCFVTSSWRGESPGLDLGTDIWRMRKELIVPSTIQPRRCPSRGPREHVREDARRFRERHEPPRHAVAGLPRDSRCLLHDGHTRIVCNRRFQVFVAVKPNRLEKTRRNSDFTEQIIVSLRELLHVYYLLLWLYTSLICLSES